jgi:hypothetical protein
MPELQVKADMQYLAGRLEHRGANTRGEREAAEYILARFREYTPNVDLDEFYCPDGAGFVTASYFAEFTVVAVFAHWWPLVALVYGGIVFTLYLAEANGYAILTRLMPQYETQNVVARFLSPRPRSLFVVMAHYDSAKSRPLTYPKPPIWLRPAHTLMVFCMFLVVATCAVQFMNVLPELHAQVNLWTRWLAVALLLAGAAVILRNEFLTENTPGINDNASGVAALLRLAHNLSLMPIKEADVYLVATGSNQTGMHGARHFIRGYDVDPESTWFLCLDSVGEGNNPAYVAELGLTQSYKPPEDLVDAAAAAGEAFNVGEANLVTPHSDAMLLLAHGFKAIEITAVRTSEEELDEEGNTIPEPINNMLIAQSADYAEATLRRLASALEPLSPSS